MNHESLLEENSNYGIICLVQGKGILKLIARLKKKNSYTCGENGNSELA